MQNHRLVNVPGRLARDVPGGLVSGRRNEVMRALGIIILAAGRGRRMRSSTPKALHLLGGKPLLSYPLRAGAGLGPEKVFVVVGHGADRIRKAFPEIDPAGWVMQRDQRGTGHAVLCARQAVGDFRGDLLILSGDVPFLSQRSLSEMLRAHRSGAHDLTLATATLADPSGYGRVLRDPDGAIAGVVEERDATEAEREIREVNVGLYVASAGFLFPALEELGNDNDQGEYYLPDTVRVAAEKQARLGSLTIDDPRECRGVNNREELAWMEKALRQDINRKWMERGVTLEDPENTYIDADAVIGEDTVIGPNSHLLGRTVVGARCHIDGSAYLTNVRLADEVHLRFSVVLDDCEVEERVSVGPFAHLRPGTVLKRNVHIGNFVEVKNSSVGESTKASHLSYIGDTELGRDSNIGAGTITCNYDGFTKRRTTIGDRVQVGSDTQLVAPVAVGDDAYIGAGSTITRDVPAGSLALSRAPQEHREGWVARFRARNGKQE